MGVLCSNVVFSLVIIGSYVSNDVSAKDAAVHVWAVTGDRAELPCQPSPKLTGDQPVLVLWYRSSHTLPIYSYDARESDFSSGVRWTGEGIFDGRAFFETNSNPPTLVLNPARAPDEGSYMCRIDYRISSSTTQHIKLKVLIPPGPPIIIWDNREVSNSAGPLKENERIVLTCRSFGGRPPPALTWRMGSRVIQPEYTDLRLDSASGTYSVEATISLRAERDVARRVVTCTAHTVISDHNQMNENRGFRKSIIKPRSTSVYLNITLAPTEVRILGSESLVVTSGTEINMKCRAIGSQPPAEVSWWRDNVPLEHYVKQTIGVDGESTATLRMSVTSDDDRSRLSCRAQNPMLDVDPIFDVIQLIVYYSPRVKLSLGPLLSANDLEEGDDVYFECAIKANPIFSRVDWYHNDAKLLHNPGRGVVIIGMSLVLRGVRRESSGSYTCSATNLQGHTTSNAVYLTVRHVPMCAGSTLERTQGATRGSSVTVKCTVEAEPAKDLTWNWVRIREDATEEEAIQGEIVSYDLSSSVSFVPNTQDDYGRILCRATNEVGSQRKACVVNLVPAGPPDSPFNCSATPMEAEVRDEVTHEVNLEISISVSCMEGFDGGLPQEFFMEAVQDDFVIANISSEFPEWVIGSVEKEVSVKIHIMAQNARGSSRVVTLEVHTSTAQQRAARGHEEEENKEVVHLLGALVGGLTVLLILIVAAVVMARRDTPRTTSSLTQVTFTTATVDGFDPDVVQSIQRNPYGLDVIPNHQGNRRSCLQKKFNNETQRQYSQEAENQHKAAGSDCCEVSFRCGHCKKSQQASEAAKTHNRGHGFSGLAVSPDCQCAKEINWNGDEVRNSNREGEGMNFMHNSNYGKDKNPQHTNLLSDDTELDTTTSMSKSSDHVYHQMSPSTSYHHEVPNQHDLSINNRQTECSEKSEVMMSDNSCNKCQTLPRSHAGALYHQHSLRRQRAFSTGAKSQRSLYHMSSSASTGKLNSPIISSQREGEFDNNLYASHGSKLDKTSQACYYERQNSLPRMKKIVPGSSVDININIPDEKGDMTIMRLSRNDSCQAGFHSGQDRLSNRPSLRRTFSEAGYQNEYRRSRLASQKYTMVSPSQGPSCLSLNDSSLDYSDNYENKYSIDTYRDILRTQVPRNCVISRNEYNDTSVWKTGDYYSKDQFLRGAPQSSNNKSVKISSNKYQKIPQESVV